jgi:hypothetical protein
MRVIISPNDAAPVEFSHRALFVPKAKALAAAAVRAEPLAREAAEAAKTADEAKKAAATAAREAASLTAPLRNFIQSQRHEGWLLVPALYDDGGGSQQVTFYDADGWIVRAPVSTGTTGRETPAGVFAIIEKQKDHLSFPKITSPRIGVMRQNHRMILQCLPSSICLGSLSSTCSGRADGLKSRISSCDISSILP